MNPIKQPNIILLTFDGGRPDHMSLAGYRKKTTPFLDSLARAGVYFAHAFATGPGSSVSFVGMFTSTYPLDHGGYGYVDRPRVLFPEVLHDAGYTTIGIHSSPYLSEYFGYNRGWDTFRYLNYFKSAASPMSPGLRRGTLKSKVLKRTAAGHSWLQGKFPFLAVIAKIVERFLLVVRKIVKDTFHFVPAFFIAEEMNAEVLKAVERAAGQPLFLWVHYLDTHAPYGLFYRKGKGLWKKMKYHLSDLAAFLFGELPAINKLFLPVHQSVYDDSLRYVDDNIRELFELLKRRRILDDDAVVVIHADHGEEFLEHGSFGHPQKLFNVNVQIPLILYSPKRFSSPQVLERPVSLIDIAPTILDFAGAKHPDSFRGKNLLYPEEREVVVQASESAGDLSDRDFTGAAIVFGGYKFITWKDQKFLFSLDDAAEHNNIYDAQRDVADNLERRLGAYAPRP